MMRYVQAAAAAAIACVLFSVSAVAQNGAVRPLPKPGPES